MGLVENNVHGAFAMPELDRCVACGLCLPVCPTYEHLQVETASPRGRLLLIRGLLNQNLPELADISKPLSLCLQCRACERACPAGVEFGWLIDVAKQHGLKTHHRHQPLAEKLIRWITLLSTRQRHKLAKIFRAVQRLGLVKIATLTGLATMLRLGPAIKMLPSIAEPLKLAERYTSSTSSPALVYMFTGCLGHMLDPDTLRATISVLTKLGYNVVVPPSQVCCGAMHLHDGDFATAKSLAEKNIVAFEKSDAPIITVVSGCGSALSEYNHLASTVGDSFASRIIDINSFLGGIKWTGEAKLKPLAAKVLVQDPCSLRNTLKSETSVYKLLGRIPELEIEALDENATCCGGAGSYPVREPEMASKLLSDKLHLLTKQSADYFVSANLGCVLHINSGLKMKSASQRFIHPISLIDLQLKN